MPEPQECLAPPSSNQCLPLPSLLPSSPLPPPHLPQADIRMPLCHLDGYLNDERRLRLEAEAEER